MTQNTSRRIWPGALIALFVASYVVPVFVPDAFLYGLLGGVVGALATLVWWLFLSRVPWSERLSALLFMAVAITATRPFLHTSIATGGQGNLFYILAIPFLCLAFLVWAVTARRLQGGARWASMIATIVLACSAWTLLRTGGVTGDGQSDFAWRWSATPEERLLARAEDVPAPSRPTTTVEPVLEAPRPTKAEDEVFETLEPPPPAPAPEERKAEAEWPGFRGPHRDGVVPGVDLETDWSQSPPIELWRRAVGPGWSSFAVAGDLLYTQEQRGDDEIVACYDARTGEPLWQHRDATRFYESNGGPGPRGTPSLGAGRVYAFGATGTLNSLDALEGTLLWSRDVASDTSVEIPGWGFASSPLVVGHLVVVAASGRLAGYDASSGEKLWLGPEGGSGYSSPHVLSIDGVEQVLLQRGSRTVSVQPADGTLLWEHTWELGAGFLQPAQTDGGDILLTVSEAMGGIGMRRVAVAHDASAWTVEERWTSRGLKPYFNDFVVHEGHVYGFDGRILASIDLENGERAWKGGRYGHGQLLLLPDQDLLLVLSEEGEVALVSATPDEFRELARFKAIEGKTWNHPALVKDILLVRNGEEMAAFRLPIPAS
jgi:outer membrane protein assembly factor BamB